MTTSTKKKTRTPDGLHIWKAKDGWSAKIIVRGRNVVGTLEGYKNKAHCKRMAHRHLNTAGLTVFIWEPEKKKKVDTSK